MKRFLILGGSGFLGRWLTYSILQDPNNAVTIFSRDAVNAKPILLDHSPRIKKINGSYNELTDYTKLVENHDVVFQLVSTSVPGSKNVKQ